MWVCVHVCVCSLVPTQKGSGEKGRTVVSRTPKRQLCRDRECMLYMGTRLVCVGVYMYVYILLLLQYMYAYVYQGISSSF